MSEAIKVLLIEKNFENAKQIQNYIQNDNMSVLLCFYDDPKEAIEAIKADKFSAILISLDFDKQDEKDIFLTTIEVAANVPVIVISDKDDVQKATQILKLGAQDCLSRSTLSTEILTRSIKYSLERSYLQTMLQKKAKELRKKNKSLTKLDQKRKEKLYLSEDKYRSLIQLAPLSIIIADTEGHVSYSNPEFKKVFGYKDLAHLNKLEDLIPSEEQKFLSGLSKLIDAKSSSPSQQPLKLLKRNGEKLWCQVTTYKIGDVKYSNQQIIFLIEDISERKKQDQIEKEKQVAEEANIAKTEFLTNISHEIRTPVTAITGFIDLAIESNRDPQLATTLDTIKRNSQHLLHLVNDLLDLSKIESGQLDIHPANFSLIQEIETVINMVHPFAQEKNIKLDLKYQGLIPKTISSDPQKFRQIFINLLNNAIKYTDEGKVELTVKVKINESANNFKVVGKIKDTGIGIGPKLQQQLFLPFARGSRPNIFKEEGMGVGLALSRRLANALGGDITLLKSVEGHGSVFEVELPAGSLENVAFYSPSFNKEKSRTVYEVKNDVTTMPLLRDVKILAVEDAHDIQVLVKHFVNKLEGSVELANNGKEALEMLEENHYDIVLMDLQMPIMSGYEAVRTLRENGYEGTIIALTAHAFKEEKDRCLEIGFDDFLAKPFNEKTLVETFLRVFRNKRHSSRLTLKKPQPQKQRFDESESMKEALEIFYKNLKKNIEIIENHIQNKRWDDVSKMAHKIKGSSLCYGYKKLANLAYDMEKSTKDNATPDLSDIYKVHEKMNHEFKQVEYDYSTSH